MDSPAVTAAANMLMEGMPRGLGLTPQGMGTGLTPGSMQMGAGGASVNGIAGLAPVDQEEERRRRVGVIVELMAGRWGYVSQEGMERCAKRLGLECMWEEGMAGGKKSLSIAGSGLLVEVDFMGQEVVNVGLSLPGSGVRDGEVRKGAGILKKGLRGEGIMKLGGFADNLERLGRMDRLGGESVNCFDAVDGIWKSLERVWEWEAEPTRKGIEQGKGWREVVMCQRSGRPVMHHRGRVGLALQYWMERRFLSEEEETPDVMDIDGAAMEVPDEDGEQIWSIIIECEEHPADLYPPIRIFDAWVSEKVEKSATEEQNGLLTDHSNIDWLEVPSTLVHAKEPADSTGGEMKPSTNEKAPDIRFIAKFEPPLIVPLETAVHITNIVGSPIPQESILPTFYDALIFGEEQTPGHPLSTNPRIFHRALTTYNPTTATTSAHHQKSTLFVQPQDFGRAITSIPFKHPMQLISLLPTLRQWALVSSILHRSFISPKPPSPPTITTTTNPPPAPAPKHQTLQQELTAFLSSPPQTTPTTLSPPIQEINLSFSASPTPTFTLHFPNPRHDNRIASITFAIGANGVFEGVDVDEGGGVGLWVGRGLRSTFLIGMSVSGKGC